MKFNLNNKGFSFSPYLMIVMMFLGIIMAFHFMVVDSEKAVAIATDGEKIKNALQEEGTKSAARNVILLSAYDYIDRGLNHPDWQVVGNSVKDIGLKKYLENYITYDLSNVASEGHKGGGAIGYWNPVTINELDDKGKVRSDGFLVSAEGSYKVEKFVDANVFSLYKYANNENSQGWRGKFQYLLLNLMASKMQGTLSGVKCEADSIWVWPSYQAGIVCYSGGYTDEDPDVNEFCTDSPYQVTWGDRSSPCWEDREVKPFMRDAGETLEKIKEALIDAQRTIAMGDYYYIKATIRAENITVKLDITKVTASTSVTCENGRWCCSEGKKDCLRDDQDYIMHVNTNGAIEVEETFISQAQIREDDAAAGSFEICYENPIMTKDGRVFPLTVKKKFTYRYNIYASYRLDCPPSYMKAGSGSCQAKKSSASVENIMTFTNKEDSLKYTLETPECAWGSIHPHVGSTGLDVVTEYRGSRISECGCFGRYSLD